MRSLIAPAKRRLFVVVLLLLAALSALSLSALAQERDRSKVPEKYKWNLADLYPSDAAWRAAKDKVARPVREVRAPAVSEQARVRP